MAETPQITNAELAKNISNLVNRWNTRENQLIDMLSQPEGLVTVTDGLGKDHSLPSFPQLQKTVNALTDDLTGAVAQAQEINSSTLAFMNEAKDAAESATASEEAAKESQDASAASQTSAANSATAAASSQSKASTSETNAKSSETKASASQTAAATSESKAKTSEQNAKTSETNAKASETNAKSSETAAGSSASYSDAAKNAAATSATNAATSESKAKTSETNSKTSETNSASSATAAANSKTAAGTSETNAKGSENTAKAYADNAGFSAAAADSSKTAAAGSKDLAAQYANAAVNIQVEPGKYSAFHWSEQARLTAAGALIYRGQWSASTGAYPLNPKLGDFYIVSVAGTVGSVKFGVGDMLVRDEANWDKIDNQQNVTSVAGRTGAVTLSIADIASLQSSLDGKLAKTAGAAALEVFDTRTVLDAPASFAARTFRSDFKTIANADSPPVVASSTYAHVLTMMGWDNGGSGGWPTQMSLGDGLAIRRGSNATTWGPWRTVWHNGNFDPTTKLDASKFTWSQLPGVPSLAAAVHTHAISDVTGLQTKLDGLDVAGKATLAAGDDLIPNPTFDSRYDRMSFTVLPSTDPSVPAGCPHPYVAKLASRDHTPSIDAFPVEPGDVIECSALVAVAAGGKDSFNLYLRCSPFSNWAPGGAGGYTYASVKGQTVAAAGTGWTRVTARWTVPANGTVRWILPFLQVSQNAPDYGTVWFATDWHCRKVTNLAAVDAAKLNKAGDAMTGQLRFTGVPDGTSGVRVDHPTNSANSVEMGWKNDIPRLRVSGAYSTEPSFQIVGVSDVVRLDVPPTGDMTYRSRKVWDSGNFDPATKQAALGWTPVQQGTGVGQSTNAVKIGYGGNSKLKLTIDVTDFGNIALESWVNGAFVPLAGGTVSGNIAFTSAAPIDLKGMGANGTMYIHGYGGNGDDLVSIQRVGVSNYNTDFKGAISSWDLRVNGGYITTGQGHCVVSNNGTAGFIYLRPNGATSAAGQFQVTSIGDAICSSWVYANNFKLNSDKRLKSKAVVLNARTELARLKRLIARRYTKAGKVEYGFFAQEFDNAYPTMVTVGDGPAGPDTHSISQMELIAPIVAVIQDIDRRLTEAGL